MQQRKTLMETLQEAKLRWKDNNPQEFEAARIKQIENDKKIQSMSPEELQQAEYAYNNDNVTNIETNYHNRTFRYPRMHVDYCDYCYETYSYNTFRENPLSIFRFVFYGLILRSIQKILD